MTDRHRSLLAQLRATQAGDPWFGASRESILDGVTAAEAAAHPVPGAHSIWELVLHMTAWTREVLRRLMGGEPAEPEDGDWPAVTDMSDAAWRRAQRALAESHAALVAELEAMPEERWAAPVGATREPGLGTGVDVSGMVAGLAQHDAYHTGQVALLRRAGVRG